MKLNFSCRISSLLLATTDSFPTSEQTSQTSNSFEEINFNTTKEHNNNVLKSDNDKELPSDDVFQDLRKPSDPLDEESLVESRTQAEQIETVIERNEISSKENVQENFDTITGVAEAIILDSISTNSGING